MPQPRSRFTLRGGAEVEERITSLVNDVAVSLETNMNPSQYRAVVLLGGYGRGEGGVEVVNGAAQAHNNLDFLVITNGLPVMEQEDLRRRLFESLTPLTEKYKIELDLSVTTAGKLKRSRSLVIWYDMRFGHKTILGDESFVPSLTHFDVDRIPHWDVRNLLVNRGTLLVINDALLEKGLDADSRRQVIRHAMKAVAGYGDALLYFLGHFHWSYAEKQRRMASRHDVPSAFRALYDEALEFRFEPRYTTYLKRDLAAWMNELRCRLSPIHRTCEGLRLGSELPDWAAYPSRAMRRKSFEDASSPRMWLKKALCAVRSKSSGAGGSILARVGYRVMDVRDRVALAFPVVAYDLRDPDYRRLVRSLLDVESDAPRDLRRAYLKMWGQAADASFLRRWDASLELKDSEP